MKRPRYWKLEGTTPVPLPREESRENFNRWADSLDDMNRVVKQEYVGALLVSTIFLGIDENFFTEGPPLLFETAVIDESAPLGHQVLDFNERCSTWEEALVMHEHGVTWAAGTRAA